MVVANDDLDFGVLWEKSTHTVELPIENRSDQVVEVTDWFRTCSCSNFTVEPGRLAIGPRETVRVRVYLSLSPAAADSKDPTRQFETTLAALSGDRFVSPRWTIHGTIRNVLAGLPKQVECEPVSDLADSSAETVLELTPIVPLHRVAASIEPAWATAEVVPLDDGRYRVKIRPKLPVAIGDRFPTLRLLPTDPRGEVLPAHEVKIAIRGLTDVQPDPPKSLLGVLPEDEIGTVEVGFRSLTGSTFEVEPVHPAPSGITVERHTSASGPRFGIMVRGASGSQVVPVEFLIRQPNRAAYTVRFEVAYHGTK